MKTAQTIMKTILIYRYRVTDDYSLGQCFIRHESGITDYIGATLERGWKDNQNNISCVPKGTYELRLERSPKFRKDLWELYGVPNRAECKFHAANYWNQLNGCIALGVKHRDINGDRVPDITSSRPIMKKFHEAMRGTEATVIIRDL